MLLACIITSIQFEDNTFTIQLNGIKTIVEGFDSNKLFNVSNTKIVGFIPIDVDGKNGLLRFGNSSCDFVFFDENYFCFLELKLNVISTEERSRHKNRTKGSIHY